MKRLHFFLNFLKDRQIGAIFPSSRFVHTRVLSKIKTETIKTVIEYGPGNGVLTKTLLKKLPKNARFIVIETNKKFCEELKKINDSRLEVIHGDAKKVDIYLKKLKIKEVDLILSSIPLSFFNEQEIKSLLKKTKQVLTQGGKFIIYNQYSSKAGSYLKGFFNNLKSQMELRNIPPAFIFEMTQE
ncbi:MAG: methyltransferase domain-containing protein [Chlamydiae bacterium]|nr:methyltransferase domain-containing protein [Chlamydiota bacterium]MBI3277212.1 methyltransferase domain-containing protein [Chlamydiota bacterium]